MIPKSSPMIPTRSLPATPVSAAPEDASRRRLGGLLLGALAATAVGGCLTPVEETAPSEGEEEQWAEDAAALTGTPVKWGDTSYGTTGDDGDLKVNTGSLAKAMVVFGHHVRGDGGGGVFYWDTDTTSADDGGTIVVPTGGPRTGCWKRLYSGPLDVRWFGAVPGDPTQASANVMAIQKAIAVAAKTASGVNGGRVFFPQGKWHIDATIKLTTIDSVTLEAAGGGYFDEYGHMATSLVWTGAPGGPMIQLTSACRCSIRHLLLNGAGLATTGLRVDATTGATGNPSKFCLFVDFQIISVTGVALHVGNDQNPDMVNHTFSGFWIYDCAVGVRQEGNQCVNHVYERGLVAYYTVNGMEFLGGDITVTSVVFSSAMEGGNADVYVSNRAAYARFTNNYHETYSGTSYLFEPFVAGQTFNRPQFTLFQGCRIQFTSTTGKIIDFRQTGYVTVIGCQFDGFNGNPAEVYWAPPGGANAAYVQEIGCVYINGARTVYAGAIGGYMSNLNYGGLNPSNLPLPYTADFATPNALTAMAGTTLNLHNSVMVLEDTYPNNAVLMGWKVRSQTGVLRVATTESRPSGTVLTVANDTSTIFSLDAAGGPGFYGVSPPASKPVVAGSTAGNAALQSLLSALTSLGLITNNTT